MENLSANCLLTLPIGDKILEVEVPGDDVSPQGATEGDLGGVGGVALIRGYLDLERMRICLGESW